MGVCKKVKRSDLKWYQILWNKITGKDEKNYAYVEVKETKKNGKN